MSDRIHIEVPVEFDAVVVSYDPHFDLVLVVLPDGDVQTHMLFVFSPEHQQAILEAAGIRTIDIE